MTKDELKKLIDGLDDDSQIILINTREQAKLVPRELIKDCPQITVGDKMVVYWKKIKGGVVKVATVWVFALAFLPEITPTPIAVVEFAYDQVKPLVEQFDYRAPYSENIAAFPYIAYKGSVVFAQTEKPKMVTYAYPPSGFDQVAITANTNIQFHPPPSGGRGNV